MCRARRDVVDVVGDDHEWRCRGVGCVVVEGVDELLATAEVEPGGGLVEQDDRRIVHQRAGQQHPLALARRQRFERSFGEAADAHPLEARPRPIVVVGGVAVPPRFQRGEAGGADGVEDAERRVAADRRGPPRRSRRAGAARARRSARAVRRAPRRCPTSGGRRGRRPAAARSCRCRWRPRISQRSPSPTENEMSSRMRVVPRRITMWSRSRASTVSFQQRDRPMIVIEPQHRLACPPVTRGRTSAAVRRGPAHRSSTPLLGGAAGAETDDDAAKRAAEEIQAARDRANQAAADFFAAQSELETLGDEAERLAAENAQLQHEVDALRSTVEQVAVNRFVSSGSSGIPLLTGYRQPSEQLQAEVLVNVVTESSADAMDAYDQARVELEANQQEVADNQAAVEAKREQFEQLQAAAEAEVVHLQEVERKRLEDERIREALLAQRREEQRQRELAEQQQREAAAAQAAEAAAQAAAAAEASAAQSAAAAAPEPPSPAAPAGQSSSGPPLPAAPAPEPAAVSSGDQALRRRRRHRRRRRAAASSVRWPGRRPTATHGAPAARAAARTRASTCWPAPVRHSSPSSPAACSSSRTASAATPCGWTASDGNRYYYAHLSSVRGLQPRRVAGRGDRLRRRHRQRPRARRTCTSRCIPAAGRRSTRTRGCGTPAAEPSPARVSPPAGRTRRRCRCPRLRRTVALTPSAPSRSRNAATPAGGVPRVGQPGVGLRGIRLTCAAGRSCRHSAASSSASDRRSLTPSISAHSKLSRRPVHARGSRRTRRSARRAGSGG